MSAASSRFAVGFGLLVLSSTAVLQFSEFITSPSSKEALRSLGLESSIAAFPRLPDRTP